MPLLKLLRPLLDSRPCRQVTLCRLAAPRPFSHENISGRKSRRCSDRCATAVGRYLTVIVQRILLAVSWQLLASVIGVSGGVLLDVVSGPAVARDEAER